jgi:hypothetical protein
MWSCYTHNFPGQRSVGLLGTKLQPHDVEIDPRRGSESFEFESGFQQRSNRKTETVTLIGTTRPLVGKVQKEPIESESSHLTSLIGKFSVIRCPSTSMTTKLTSNSILKVRVAIVGQVNSRGNTIKIGRVIFRVKSPSAIWIF